VTTQDGYILNLPRIRVGELRGPPVLLQHGLFMVTKSFISNYVSWILLLMLAINVMLWLQDGITWLLLPSKQSLAFLLAENGFDVWVANTRGTKYSRQHTTLPTNSSVSFVY